MVEDESREEMSLVERHVRMLVHTFGIRPTYTRLQGEPVMGTKAQHDLLPARGLERRRVVPDLKGQIDQRDDDRYAPYEVAKISERVENCRVLPPNNY